MSSFDDPGENVKFSPPPFAVLVRAVWFASFLTRPNLQRGIFLDYWIGDAISCELASVCEGNTKETRSSDGKTPTAVAVGTSDVLGDLRIYLGE